MSIEQQNIIDAFGMKAESFAQDVVSDAYLEALDMPNRKITIPQLDKICQDHPWYDEIELDALEAVVAHIETHLVKEEIL